MMKVLVYAMCCVAWGSAWMVVGVGLKDVPPLEFAAFRMLAAAIALTPLALRAGATRLSRRAWVRMAITGPLQIALPYALMFAAQESVPSSLSAIFFCAYPVWLYLAARLLLPKSRLTLLQLFACAIGLLGIVVIELPAAWGHAISGRVAIGGALIVVASMMLAVSAAVVKRWLSDVPPLLLTWGQLLVSAAVLFALVPLLESGRAATWTPRAIGAVVYLAVFATAIPYVAFYWLMSRVPVVAIGAVPLVDTTIAVVIGCVVLGEALGPSVAIGGGLVLVGAAMAGVRRAPAS